MGYFTKVSGVSFENRQETIATLREGQMLYFEREIDNPYDRYAVKVMTMDQRQIGYLSKDQSERISKNLDKGTNYSVEVVAITGGGLESHFGVNICVKELYHE